MNKEIFEKVRAFVAEYRSVKINKLSEQTTLLRGLGMDGDDAGEFIEEFMKRFLVNMSEFEFD